MTVSASAMAVALTSSAALLMAVSTGEEEARCEAELRRGGGSARITVHRSDRSASRAVSESDRAVEDGRSWMSKEAIDSAGKEVARRRRRRRREVPL